ncbi:MAG: NusG domain II-containing protein [Dictyoglomaceae bacterium]|nr:NusG domain II-containing protein [Dictyoglomaceae bacterium]
MKRKESFIVFFLFLISMILWIFQKNASPPLYLIVEVNNKEILKININSLKLKKEFNVDGILGKSYFECDSEKGVRMISSPCPDKLCIKQGWIKKVGETIVCLPNRVVLRFEGKK